MSIMQQSYWCAKLLDLNTYLVLKERKKAVEMSSVLFQRCKHYMRMSVCLGQSLMILINQTNSAMYLSTAFVTNGVCHLISTYCTGLEMQKPVRLHLKQKMLVRIQRMWTSICKLLCFPTAASVFLILIRNAKSALFRSIQIYFTDSPQFIPTMKHHCITAFTTVVKQVAAIIK